MSVGDTPEKKGPAGGCKPDLDPLEELAGFAVNGRILSLIMAAMRHLRKQRVSDPHLSYRIRLISSAWSAWATSGSLSRDGADRDRGPGNGLRRLVRDRRAFRSTGWRAARRQKAHGVRPAARRGGRP